MLARRRILPLALAVAAVLVASSAMVRQYQEARRRIANEVARQQLLVARSGRDQLEWFDSMVPALLAAIPPPPWRGANDDARPWLEKLGHALEGRHVAGLELVVFGVALDQHQSIGVQLDHEHPPIQRVPPGEIGSFVCPKCLDDLGLVEWWIPLALEPRADPVPAVLVLRIRVGEVLDRFFRDLGSTDRAASWVVDQRGRLILEAPGAAERLPAATVRDAVLRWIALGLTEGTSAYGESGPLAFASTRGKGNRFFVVVAAGDTIDQALRSSAAWIAGAWTFGLSALAGLGFFCVRGAKRISEVESNSVRILAHHA